MRKFIFNVCVAMALALTACGTNANNKTKLESKVYSNLASDTVRNDAKNIFKDANIPDVNIDKIITSVEKYNTTIGTDLLFDNKKLPSDLSLPEYDTNRIDERWLNDNDMFIGYNCRITAFELMKDFISVRDTDKSNPTALYLDQDALSYSKDDYFTSEELEKFEAIYSTIETTSSTDVKEQYNVQKKYWEDIGVSFSNDSSVSLISVYLHNHFSDTDNELIVGHTGVLFDTGDEYMFFEKLSFQLPYQMIRFETKQELKSYLMKVYDVDTTGECAKPFILENDELME